MLRRAGPVAGSELPEEIQIDKASINLVAGRVERGRKKLVLGHYECEILKVLLRRRGEVVERMFNPFFTTREAGTGLGLAIVHRIVDAHGGRVSVSNNGPRVGDGATVEIMIPSRRTDAPGSVLEHVEAHG